MAPFPSVARDPRPSNEAPPSSFLDLLKQDLENPAFNDIQLESSDEELVPCSRFILCKRSTVFADLLEFPDETVFPTPFPAWLMREIRHVCYFGMFSFKDLQPIDDTTVRKLCQLLVAMDYYQLDDTLSKPICIEILEKMDASPSLACIVIDELGLGGYEEARPWIAKSVKKAARLLKISPQKVLLPDKKGVGGVCSIQDVDKIQQILSTLKTQTNIWLEYEVLYAWANAKDSNRVAAAELWEETEMLARLKAVDADYFKTRNLTAFNADSFGWSQDFVELNQYAGEKRRVVRTVQRNAPCAKCDCAAVSSLRVQGVTVQLYAPVSSSFSSLLSGWHMGSFSALHWVGFNRLSEAFSLSS